MSLYLYLFAFRLNLISSLLSALRPLPQAAHSCNADKYHDFSIVDRVVVPEDLDTGHYLLSWRWDCEQTTQIWQNCADVMVV
jgi:hypothetical protein